MSNQDTDLAELVAEAIDTIHMARFVVGREPTKSEEPIAPAFHMANDLAVQLHLRMFQRNGISSKVVANAVRAGVLRVVLVQP